MIVLVLRTDNPDAEIGLYDGESQLAYIKWQAHRELAETIHRRLYEILEQAGRRLEDTQGIVVYRGPGSFTGLRIGISVANALAYGLSIPVAGSTGTNWIALGQAVLDKEQGSKQVIPEYGAPVHITAPKK